MRYVQVKAHMPFLLRFEKESAWGRAPLSLPFTAYAVTVPLKKKDKGRVVSVRYSSAIAKR